MIETRAYDASDTAPVLVLVITGVHDVSRMVDLLHRGNCEHALAAARVVRQVRRHNGGRAALRLLARHGGPDFTTEEPT